MKTTRTIGPAVGAGLAALALIFTACSGGDAKKLQSENEALRAEVEALRAQAATPEAEAARQKELTRLRASAEDAVRLRGEVTRLTTASKDADKLRAENQQLRSENQKLRGQTADAATVPPTPPSTGVFPRDSWSQAGYASPEAALVSAIYSMQTGNPKQYFESLTPEEQARMTKVWEGKSPEEIAAKHQSDTEKITGLRVLNQQSISDSEVQMSVYIDGVDRTEKLSMKRVGNDWRFDGFVRPPKP